MEFSTDIEDLLYHLFPGKKKKKKMRLRNMTYVAGKAWFMASSSPPFTVFSIVEQRRNTKLSLPVSQNSANVALGLS